MKKMMIAMLALAGTGAAQDPSKDRIETPIKNSSAPEKFDLARTGIEWHRGLESVAGKGRPILLFQLLGNFDEVFC